jgi:hypothetical protein
VPLCAPAIVDVNMLSASSITPNMREMLGWGLYRQLHPRPWYRILPIMSVLDRVPVLLCKQIHGNPLNYPRFYISR